MLGAGMESTILHHHARLHLANVAATRWSIVIHSVADVAIAGGAESLSDPPIRLSKNLRQALVKSQKAKGAKGYLEIVKELSPEDLIPAIPSAAEFSTGLTIGESCERFAKRVRVSSKESDEFAARSPVLARAWVRAAMSTRRCLFHPRWSWVRDDGRAGTRRSSRRRFAPCVRPRFRSHHRRSSSFDRRRQRGSVGRRERATASGLTPAIS